MIIAPTAPFAPILRGVEVPFNTEEEWLALRSQGLGSTDFAAALGISKYKTPYQLWEEKVGIREPFAGNKRTIRGKALEPLIAEHYATQNNVQIHAVNTMYRHVLHPCLTASIDRLVYDPKRGWGLVECKSTDSFVYESWDMESFGYLRNGVISNEYFAQGMGQLMVTGLAWVDIHILIVDEWQYRTFTVERDEKVIEGLEHDLPLWWETHVTQGIPPEKTAVDWGETTPVAGATVDVTDEDAARIARYFDLKGQIKDLTKQADTLYDTIVLTIKDAETVNHNGAPVATWKQQSRQGISVEAVRERFGENADDLITTSTFRVLRQKKGK